MLKETGQTLNIKCKICANILKSEVPLRQTECHVFKPLCRWQGTCSVLGGWEKRIEPLHSLWDELACYLQEVGILTLELLVLFPRGGILDYEDLRGVPVDVLAETTEGLVLCRTRPKVTLTGKHDSGRDSGQNLADCFVNGILSSAFASFIGSFRVVVTLHCVGPLLLHGSFCPAILLSTQEYILEEYSVEVEDGVDILDDLRPCQPKSESGLLLLLLLLNLLL